MTMNKYFEITRIIITVQMMFFCLIVISAQSNIDREFPLKISSNNHYLVDHNNRPFFIQADTPWSLFVALSKTDAETYLENRFQKGFNAITVNLIEHWFNGDSTAYPYASVNKQGEKPFSDYLKDGNVDFTKPNNAYFEHVDYLIRKALDKRILVMLTPAYMGYIGQREGWYTEVLANGPDRCREYGRYLGKRYRNFPNICWIMDGDRNPDSLSRPLEREIIAGIKEFDNIHLFTAHCHPTNSSRDQWEGDYWLDLNAVYTYNDRVYVYEKCLDNYRRLPAKPTFLFETAYEGEHDYTPPQIRAEMYWGWLCSIGGQQMGNNPIWKFAKGWQAAMDGQGSMDAARLKKLVDSRKWFNLVPDYNHEVVTNGYGSGESYVSAARTMDGETVIIYIPQDGTSIDVDLTNISGRKTKAWWFNPRDGESSLIGKFLTRNTETFQKPDSHDWVLVIDKASANLTIPGR
jgi:hypothetical protein